MSEIIKKEKEFFQRPIRVLIIQIYTQRHNRHF